MQIAFYKGKDRVFNQATAWWLRGDYSHCELVLGTNHIGQAICASSSFMDGGVRVKHMWLDPDHWDLVEVGGDIEAAWSWVREHDGDGYDLWGLTGHVARRIKQDQTRWTCCEAVAAMLGILEPWRLDPCALYIVALALRARLPLELQQPATAGFFTPVEAGAHANA
ncbi:hypothetical protein LJR118_000621 [Acidovorax sp. LjRoot118]|uniref:hypothetical protein n=1 Tax=Acidovorax sp. LjRoot118 TaxID=3342256 RepID=UPI003ECC8A49